MFIHRVFYILVFFVNLFNISAFSQVSRHVINWEKIRAIKSNDFDSLHVLNFDQAIYLEEWKNLPVYYTQIPLNSKKKIFYKVENEIYQELTDVNLPKLTDKELINSSIGLKQNISCQSMNYFCEIFIMPLRINNITGSIEQLVSFDLVESESFEGINDKEESARVYTSNSVLASGLWYKVGVTQSGIYKLTYDDFTNMGLQVLNPANIRVFGNGGGMLPQSNSKFRYDDLVENPIYVKDGGDGSFDPGDFILFYGEGPTEWNYSIADAKYHHITHQFSDESFYFINVENVKGLRIIGQNNSSQTPNVIINKFEDYAVYENDAVNLIKSGREWYGESFNVVTQYNFPFNFPDIDVNSNAQLNTSLLARSNQSSTYDISIAGSNFSTSFGSVSLTGNGNYANIKNDAFVFTPNSSTIDCRITYNKPNSASSGWLNFIEINVIRNLIYRGNQLIFRNMSSVGAGKVTEFNISNANANMQIWEISTPTNPKNQQYNLNSSSATYILNTDSLREFIAFETTNVFTPNKIGIVNNQNLHALGVAKLIIVTASEFLAEAQRLAEHHRVVDGFLVHVATVDEVYNEFSSGAKDVTAIRDFVKMFYDRNNGNISNLPKYLLLFGDGSYDNKNRLAGNTAFIPTFQSANSVNLTYSYVTDDYFGLMDDTEGEEAGGALDIGVGRIPVQSIEESRFAVDKIIRYASKTNLVNSSSHSANIISNFADWRNVVCFAADDEDGNLHVSQADSLARMVARSHPKYNIEKIYFDAFPQISTPGGQRYPDATTAFNNRVQKGALIFCYTGHGGELGLAQERVLEISNIESWTNKYNMPAFFTATCEFSRFDDPQRTSAGELVFLNSRGGGIGLYTTTRLSLSHSNFALTKSFIANAFNQVNNDYYRMGDLIRIAKVANGSSSNNRNFVLLGDPALQLAYPKFNINTTNINANPITSVPDTLKALSLVTITGEINNLNNQLMSNFNGYIVPTVYDKVTRFETLANDPQSSSRFPFLMQKNILYKGNVSVRNGIFSFSFIVPKDIAYSYGSGKISYYASSDSSDANGYFNKFIIGGTAENFAEDIEGPEIRLYMNDTTFVFGNNTSEDPLMLGYIYDIHGINTVGNGIGHDITAILDDDEDNAIVLNDFYISNLDNFQRGIVKYPFSDLSEGLHRLKLKVWDVYNNSNMAYTEFVVASSIQMALSNILNYPNPFKDGTYFRFDHNQAGYTMDVEVEIFNLNGQMLKTIKSYINTEGYQSEPIFWDGRSNYGEELNSGIYIYKIKVKSETGAYAEFAEKLVIIK